MCPERREDTRRAKGDRERARVRKKGKWTNTGEGMNPTGQAGEATDAAKLTQRRWGCGREVGWGPSSAQLTRKTHNHGHRLSRGPNRWPQLYKPATGQTPNSISGPAKATKDQPKPSWNTPLRQAPGMSAQAGKLGAVNKPEMQVSGVQKPEKPRYLGGSGIHARARKST